MIQLTNADIGKKFLTRAGDVVNFLTTRGSSSFYPFEGDNGETYTAQGTVLQCGDHDADLVSRIEEPESVGAELLPPVMPTAPPRRNCVPLENTVKDSNPKDAVGVRKVPMSCVPTPVVAELAVAMMEGARKYGRHNYREIGVRASVYYDAAHRHLGQWWEGEDTDSESGLSHITKAIATLAVLRDAMIRGKCVDDRPRGTIGFIRALNEVASAVVDRFPNPEEPFLAKGHVDTYGAESL